jgi:hypothetical protein
MIGPIIGWLGNLFLIWGHFAIGNKRSYCFALVAIGEVFWLARSIQLGIWDGVFLGAVFLWIQLVNQRKWQNDLTRRKTVI